MKRSYFLVLAILICLFTNSCKKNSSESNSTYPYNVRMTDSPGPYSAVYIDLQGVEVTGSDGKAVTLNIHTGIYNLLDFTNGRDTILGSGTLDVSTVEQIRLILGSNNSVVVDSVSYPLSTPSAEQSGLKLQVHQALQAGILYSVLLDFDANQSIVNEGNGSYKLKPVIRTITESLTGSIKGNILPIGAHAYVTATSGSNVSYSTNVSLTGDFLLMGVPQGIYTVTITPDPPLKQVTLTNITVTNGIVTTLGTIDLH